MGLLDDTYEEAKKYMVMGVASSGKYNKGLGKSLILKRGDGCTMTDLDGNVWIDYHTSSGASILGYNHPAIKKALHEAVEMGHLSYMETEYNLQLAKKICSMVPSAERVRFCNSGTEATIHAIRLARAYSKKKKIVKFEGHFHGMHELIFFNWRERLGEVLPEGNISLLGCSDGILDEYGEFVVVLPWNNEEVLESYVSRHKDEIAGIICEPVMFNAGCIEPKPGFLQKIREVATKNEVVLIFDEVLSGFRMHKGGAQGFYSVTPDLTTLSKALGAGLTIAALVGKKEIMEELAPMGHTSMSGTYTGSSFNVMGALAALNVMDSKDFYPDLTRNGNYLFEGIERALKNAGLRGHVQGLCSRFGIFFGFEEKTWDLRDCSKKYNTKAGSEFIKLALGKRLYFHHFGDGVVPMHSGITSVHTREILDESLNKMEDVFKQMVRQGF